MRAEGAPDHDIARVAGAQGGVVGRAQLLDLGLSAKAVGRRIHAGRLHPLHRAVYAVGHRAVGEEGRRWAAVLALGDGAVLSHASAASAWDIRRSATGLIHVAVPGRGGRKRRQGVRVHRPGQLRADEITALAGLPSTTPARTLLDLAALGLRGRPLEAALDRAELLRVLDFADLTRLLARYPRRAGSPALAALLSRYVAGTVDTRSVLEELVLELCDAHGLPRPRVNRVVEGRERDFLWPRARLVVEADSYSWHRSPTALNHDRERDVELTLAGYRCLRFTWEQVTRRREYVARAILSGLGRVQPLRGG
jgi:very-short-patch-repair endonuclease